MSPMNRFSSMIEGIKERASVQTVYGEPINRGGKTLVPVARVMFGFGGGEGEPGEQTPGGVGGGGGLMARPLGMYEIDSEGDTRFIPINSRRNMFRGVLLGLLLGLVTAGVLLGRLQSDEETDFSI